MSLPAPNRLTNNPKKWGLTQNEMKKEPIKVSFENKKQALSDGQIELIADIYAQGNQHSLCSMDTEWLLSHAFQLGAKFYREFTTLEP